MRYRTIAVFLASAPLLSVQTASFHLGGKPEYAASAGDGKLYANLEDKDEIVEIDTKRASVIRRWPKAPCKQPVTMAIDTVRHRLFSGCRLAV